jgi:hypothetical protein
MALQPLRIGQQARIFVVFALILRKTAPVLEKADKALRSSSTPCWAGATDQRATLAIDRAPAVVPSIQEGDGSPPGSAYIGHAKRENRNGLAVDGGITQASGTAERESALAMLALLQPG